MFDICKGWLGRIGILDSRFVRRIRMLWLSDVVAVASDMPTHHLAYLKVFKLDRHGPDLRSFVAAIMARSRTTGRTHRSRQVCEAWEGGVMDTVEPL